MSDDRNSSITFQAEESPTPTMSEPSKEITEHTLTRHSVYYFDPVVFRVEGVLFKVPKYGLMVPGSMFYDMFSLPIPEGEKAHGSSDSNPIELPSGITPQELFGFLFLLYPFFGHANTEIGYEELVGALKLGTMWEFTKIRNIAICLLSPMFKHRDPAETVLLAKQCQLKSVLRQGYMDLIDRYNTIDSLRVPHQLDWVTIAKIFAAQAHSLARTTRPRSFKMVDPEKTYKTNQNISPDISLEAYLDIVFAEEFDYMENMEDEKPEFGKIEREFQRFLSSSTNSTRIIKSEVSPGTFRDVRDMSFIPPGDRRHHIYYIDMISIRINTMLFRVPKTNFLAFYEHFLFADKGEFKSASSNGVLLPGITEHSFCALLWTLYPINNAPLNYTYEEWLDVLYLSTLWGMKEIRQRAVTELTPLIKGRPLVETVLTARKYHVKNWLLDTLEGLVVQNPTFTIQGLRDPFELDWETIAKLFSIRDRSIDYSEPPVQRPKTRCKWCTSGSSKNGYRCPYTCRNLNLDEFEFSDDENEEIKGADDVSGLNLKRPVNSETARAIVQKEFGDEVRDW